MRGYVSLLLLIITFNCMQIINYNKIIKRLKKENQVTDNRVQIKYEKLNK